MTALFSSGELADLREALLAMYRPHFRRVAANELHFQRMARDSISEERSLEHLRALEKDVGPLPGKRTLEVGAGIGLTLAVARKPRADAMRHVRVRPSAAVRGGAAGCLQLK